MGLQKSTLDELRIDRRSTAPDRSYRWVWLGLICVLLLLAVGAWWFFRADIPKVRVLVVQESVGGGQRVLLNASGYVVARREAVVSSKVTGKVVEVLIEEGMRVQQGQMLARLDSSNVKSSLDLAEAQLASAKSALEETKVRVHEAEREFVRITGLATNRVSSEADLDHATAEFKSFTAHLQQQEKEVTVSERQVALWQQQMDDNLIRAPFDGIVVSKNAQPGEMISPISAGGGFTRTGICTIVDMESLEVEIDVNESYINRVQAGQPVVATLDAYPDWKIPCKVKAIIPTADRQKATVKVRVSFDKLDPRILPEMGVKVGFQAGPEMASQKAALTIPRTAVQSDGDRAIVFLLANDKIERRAIKLGELQGAEAVVTAGLAAGDKVVLDGSLRLRERMPAQESLP